ncbi:hypothetical protein JW998_01365 [candidate division KSB1 bacterium]|nr:hypothetical protein [candidate division KSB1 bacterium]
MKKMKIFQLFAGTQKEIFISCIRFLLLIYLLQLSPDVMTWLFIHSPSGEHPR